MRVFSTICWLFSTSATSDWHQFWRAQPSHCQSTQPWHFTRWWVKGKEFHCICSLYDEIIQLNVLFSSRQYKKVHFIFINLIFRDIIRVTWNMTSDVTWNTFECIRKTETLNFIENEFGEFGAIIPDEYFGVHDWAHCFGTLRIVPAICFRPIFGC